ncbi:MAG TPA: biopolymer transporter ExbD [Verrucomicrobiae bacterium]|nr:biopolymer transporter ExbD [Verrucomicrobiae bacterium]
MRRFSQRSALVTLSEINITPLLDLAFVLLIIFVITTPLLEQGLNLKLPAGNIPDKKQIDPRNVRTVEVDQSGNYMMAKRVMPLDEIIKQLKRDRSGNPQILVYIRADERGSLRHTTAILYQLELAGIDQVSIRTDPSSR